MIINLEVSDKWICQFKLVLILYLYYKIVKYYHSIFAYILNLILKEFAKFLILKKENNYVFQLKK